MQAVHSQNPKAESNDDPRFYFRRILIAIGLFFFMGICLIGHQTQENQRTLQAMRGTVESVRLFQNKEGRLPTREEVEQLPGSGQRGYNIVTRSGVAGDERLNVPFPEGGWALTLWLGEFWEVYTSWDNHYTLAEVDELWEIMRFDIFWFSLACIAAMIAVYRKWGHPRKVCVAVADEPPIQKVP